jgi:hypothetical protein
LSELEEIIQAAIIAHVDEFKRGKREENFQRLKEIIRKQLDDEIKPLEARKDSKQDQVVLADLMSEIRKLRAKQDTSMKLLTENEEQYINKIDTIATNV